MPKLSHQQQLMDFCIDYGIPKIMLRANEEFEAASCTGDMAVLKITRWIVRDTSSARIVEGRTNRLEVWRKIEGTWMRSPKEGLEVRDTDFETVNIPRWDRSKSVREWIETTRWERMCYRPGTAKSPMDGYGAAS